MAIELSDTSEIMEKFYHFVTNEYKKELGKTINQGSKSFVIDFQRLDMYDPDMAELLVEEPKKLIDIFEDALMQYEEGVKEKLFIRFTNLPVNNFVKIRDIRSEHLGKLLYTEGIVRQASAVRPMCTLIIYKCLSCEQKVSVLQGVTTIKIPEKCPNCGKKAFEAEKHKLVDTQRLVLEESSESLEGGQPMRLNVFLRNDLVDPGIVKRNTPGSKVRITGVIYEFAQTMSYSKNASVMYEILLESNYTESIEREYEDIEVTEEDVRQIELLAKDPEIYDKLIRSMSPSIRGKNKIKEAMVLQMFGGVRKERKDGTKSRGDIHILLIGDPGTGKSQLVKSMAAIAPKARFVSGKGATGAGLTATVVKDEILKGWALEAGALVLANRGILCIDEIDKMSTEDRSAMHEAMEQQTISISKANVQATLNCQTSIIAAANPKYGRFDPYKPIAEQIDMPITLLSRFDLIFPIRDIPDKEEDTKLAEHILLGHQDAGRYEPMIPPEIVRKYVSYAKQTVKPKLTDAAVEEIQNFFVNLRNKEVMHENEARAVPLTPRQLEALVRLSEASAKIRLSKKVLKQDAKRAISLMKSYLTRLGMDPETQELDIDRVISGTTTSQRSKIYEIIDLLKDLEKSFGRDVPVNEIITEAKSRGIDELRAEEIIEKMKRSGEIYEPKHGVIRRSNRNE
ncbi:AAA family ATPase [archaeon CG07_land_8_20_14_0_80_38_8]|nr:MAG: AAA family ATPase [archaeon CG07_land_8_20_14_0_80_38_8]PIU88824.1 MAG: AAA family ATPase [archaeon CG06_land_8_20_14_3_00_37_11]